MPASDKAHCGRALAGAMTAALALGLGSGVALAQNVTFEPLGFMNGFPQVSIAWGISADGNTVVGEGYSGISQPETEAWRRVGTSGPLQGMGTLNGTFFSSTVFGVNANGTFLAGQSWADSQRLYHPVRVYAPGAPGQRFKDMGGLPSTVVNGTSYAINGDGSRLAGVTKSIVSGQQRDQAFRYVVTNNSPFTGLMTPLGFLPGGVTSQANGISADGNTVVGFSSDFTVTTGFRWDDGVGMTALACPAGMAGGSTVANAVSGDRSTIVGTVASASGDQRAIRWTEAGGAELLADAEGAPSPAYSAARGVSADGRVIVGFCTPSSPTSFGEACVWTYRGVSTVRSILQGAGVDVTGWEFSWANGVSADGRTIVGYGVDPQGRIQAWRMVMLPDTDFNLDGSINPDDLGDFITCYFTNPNDGSAVTCPGADYNQDRSINPDDLGDFITAYFTN